MKALVATRHGGPEVLRVEELPNPQPKTDEVLVQVEAAGINFADLMAISGRYPGSPQPPFVPGREFAGFVAPNRNQRVMGYTETGAFAEQVAVPRHRLWASPAGWSPAQAAAFPVNYFTAYLAYWKAGLLPNDPLRPKHRRPRVLIHAVAGGVGTAAVQIGKLLDVEMYGTSSSDGKLQGASALGLDHGINYTRQDYEQLIREHTNREGVDAVFEMLGGEHTGKSIRCLGFLGRCILYGTATGRKPEFDPQALYAKGNSVHGLWLSPLSSHREVIEPALAQLTQWISAGKLQPVIGHTFPLDQAAEGFRLLAERRNFGKVVLKVSLGKD
ncbi:MAG: NADPH:quinone oxidoreductase family protein [Terriglobales bacterium]